MNRIVFIVDGRPDLDGDDIAEALGIDEHTSVFLDGNTKYVGVLGTCYEILPPGDYTVKDIEEIL